MMRIRQKGLSLVEIAFVTGISVILGGLVAGAGNYLANQSAGQSLVEAVNRFDVAIQQYIQKNQTGSRPWPNPASGSDLNNSWIGPFMGTFASDYSNPYDLTSGYVKAYPATDDYNYPTNFSSSDYPMNGQGGRADRRGLIVYIYNNYDNYQYTPFWVMGGNLQPNNAYQYALQAIDDQGWPIVTICH